jgi:hypothetical protein
MWEEDIFECFSLTYFETFESDYPISMTSIDVINSAHALNAKSKRECSTGRQMPISVKLSKNFHFFNRKVVHQSPGSQR